MSNWVVAGHVIAGIDNCATQLKNKTFLKPKPGQYVLIITLLYDKPPIIDLTKSGLVITTPACFDRRYRSIRNATLD
ncbi:hypothetical protein QE152_g29782 [Popillia japonica]|uniref:Uncharacterized protein n=1 Tax=Popillia japonica TaxID=7064 RepID=A0AAW1JGF8_POPJA